MEQWEPPRPGQHWMEWLVSMMQDQETWETKYANYHLDKTKKIAHVIAKNKARPSELAVKNRQRIAEAFAEIGWGLMVEERKLKSQKKTNWM